MKIPTQTLLFVLAVSLAALTAGAVRSAAGRYLEVEL